MAEQRGTSRERLLLCREHGLFFKSTRLVKIKLQENQVSGQENDKDLKREIRISSD